MKIVKFKPGEKRTTEVDFGNYASNSGTNVSSASWSVCSGLAKIYEQTLVGDVAKCKIETASKGNSTIHCVASLADGQVVKYEFQIKAESACGG